MTTTLIVPWPLFFELLHRQRAALRPAWLRYWMFSDNGASLGPKRGEGNSELFSVDELEKIWSRFAKAQGRGRRALH
jgi:hypothetical protein